MEHGEKPSPRYKSIFELLTDVAATAANMHADARQLRVARDAHGFREAMRQRTLVLASLPDILVEYAASGGIVPDEVADFAAGLKDDATAALDTDEVLLMGTLLDQPGLRVGEPNRLEALATQYKPPGEADL